MKTKSKNEIKLYDNNLSKGEYLYRNELVNDFGDYYCNGFKANRSSQLTGTFIGNISMARKENEKFENGPSLK